GGLGDRAGRELQADGAPGLPHGAAPPPLRALGLGGAEDRRTLLDRLVRAGAARPDDPQTEVMDMWKRAGSRLVSGHLTQARLARRTRCGFALPTQARLARRTRCGFALPTQARLARRTRCGFGLRSTAPASRPSLQRSAS